MSTLPNEHINKRALWPSDGACYLCGTIGPLCHSHIIPRFVGDWLRKTNVTGRLRHSDVPNRLTQDLPWRHLLCVTCEGRFNTFETEVCETIFLPLHDRRQDTFHYGPSFVRFAVSVAWRWVVVLQREGHLSRLGEIPDDVAAAERAWREFLLGCRTTPAPHDVHAIPLGVPVSLNTQGRSSYFARWMLRGVGVSTMSRDGMGYVIVKMGRLLVFGTVAVGQERDLWKATKLDAEGGPWGGAQGYHVPGWVEGYFNVNARKLQNLVEGLSDKQKQQTNDRAWEEIRENVERVAESDVFRAFEADLELFGDSAFQRSLPDDGRDD